VTNIEEAIQCLDKLHQDFPKIPVEALTRFGTNYDIGALTPAEIKYIANLLRKEKDWRLT